MLFKVNLILQNKMSVYRADVSITEKLTALSRRIPQVVEKRQLKIIRKVLIGFS